MGDDVGRDELVDEVEVASVESLLVEPADELLVGREGVAHRAIVGRAVVAAQAPAGSDDPERKHELAHEPGR